ncbi:MAG: hypothetical protein DCC69_06630 [Hyphomicrobiales bacterium]|nr:MAG: hypothetical protein DCC69_06630 [Hyphomicrobiales bacterium]
MAKAKVHHIEEGHLVRAKQFASEAESLGRKSIEAWTRCADEIIAAKEAAKAEGRKLTDADVGRAMGWGVWSNAECGEERCEKVKRLVAWRRKHSGPALPDYPPFGGPKASEAAAHVHARKATREQPDVIIAEAIKHPDIARRIRDELDEFLGASEPDDPAPEEPPAARPRASAAEPTMTREEFDRRMAEVAQARASLEAEERAEAEAEERKFEEAERAQAEHDATPVGQVETMISRLRGIYGMMALTPLANLTPTLIDQLTPEERARLVPEHASQKAHDREAERLRSNMKTSGDAADAFLVRYAQWHNGQTPPALRAFARGLDQAPANDEKPARSRKRPAAEVSAAA